MTPEVAALIQRLADAGTLDGNAFSVIGTAIDHHVPLPAQCPRCNGEPELSHGDVGFEVSCPECNHASGTWPSRFEAVSRFRRS